MTKGFLSLIMLALPVLGFSAEQSLDQKINDVFAKYTNGFVNFIFYPIPLGGGVTAPWVLIVLIFGALFFTLYFKFINFTGFFKAIRIVRGKYDKIESDPHAGEASEGKVHTSGGDIRETIRVEHDHHGEVSHFQALTAALSGTVGLGNIAGVAVAVSIGGPGATFWMIVAGLIGMASKFTECTLGVHYREIDETGKVYGGPMYYLKKGLKAKKMKGLGQVLAVVFAIMCIGGSFGGGNMFQANQSFAMFEYYGRSPVSEEENLNNVKDSWVIYNYYISDNVTITQVEGDSVSYMSGTLASKMPMKQFVRDSTVLAATGEKLTNESNLASLIGSEIVYFKPASVSGMVKSVEGEEVTFTVDGLSEMTVAKEDFVKGGVLTPLRGYGVWFGVILALLTAVTIIGGIKKIASVTDKMVPFMVVIYVGAALAIIFMNLGEVPRALTEIFTGAFTGAGITGGVVGCAIQGFKRAAFSNEAGIGSASIAHSAVRTRYSASEGMVALLEPFIDTVIICTMTAVVIVICNGDGSIMTYGEEVKEGVQATSRAFSSAFSWFPFILTIAVFLFAFSTMISWSYYGVQAWAYLFGRAKWVEYLYKFIFCVFVIVGSASQLGAVINFSDAMIFAMLVPNMIGLFILAPVARTELKRYLGKIREEDSKKSSG